MPTLHLRGVPVALYERLRSRATAHGRSLNAEVISVLDEATRKLTWDEVFERIDERAKRIGFDASWPKPEDLIREDRDSR